MMEKSPFAILLWLLIFSLASCKKAPEQATANSSEKKEPAQAVAPAKPASPAAVPTLLYHRGWDKHGNLPDQIRGQCKDTDQPQAALFKDLKRLGMLDDTLVIWCGEFGRTTYSQGVLTQTNYGRDHHPRCFTMWFAGGGTKPGISYGKTDD